MREVRFFLNRIKGGLIFAVLRSSFLHHLPRKVRDEVAKIFSLPLLRQPVAFMSSYDPEVVPVDHAAGIDVIAEVCLIYWLACFAPDTV